VVALWISSGGGGEVPRGGGMSLEIPDDYFLSGIVGGGGMRRGEGRIIVGRYVLCAHGIIASKCSINRRPLVMLRGTREVVPSRRTPAVTVEVESREEFAWGEDPIGLGLEGFKGLDVGGAIY